MNPSPSHILSGKHVALCVCGGISAYKAAELLRLLKKAGAAVSVAMTPGAQRFITPLTFEALSGRPVYSEIFEGEGTGRMEHIRSAEQADLLIVAPATANTLARMAQGLAGDPVCILYSAYCGPVMVAPAMNDNMWRHPALQDNLKTLRSRGVAVVEPDTGELACGSVGPGRLPEPEVLLQAISERLLRKADFAGKRVLVTAGPTCEPLDPVRYITNRSSGKMGYAIAQNAAERGAEVTLVSGPTHLPAPQGVRLLSCMRVAEMRDLVMRNLPDADVLVMTAAVGDFAPEIIEKEKIKKQGEAPLVLNLAPTPDILKEVSALAERPLLVGFAAESENLLQAAQEKFERKRLDLMVANDISAPGIGFQSDDNQVTLISRDREPVELPRMSKLEIAGRILDRVLELSA